MSEENLKKSAFDEPEEEVIFLSDVLKEQEEREQEAAAIYGASDEQNCSYETGYVKRQALLACLTCCPESADDLSKCAGVCLACSLKCHENHNLVELYTKRNFRCDCGTKKIPNTKCAFITEEADEKLPINSENLYNHNFQGNYCTCKRPYPDPENPNEDAMIKCDICEDWYHNCHLETTVPSGSEYLDLICSKCLKEHEILQHYSGIAVKAGSKEDESLDVSVECDDKLKSDLDKSISDILNMSSTSSGAGADSQPPPMKKIKMQQDSVEEFEKECRMPKTIGDYESGGLFFPQNWRDFLCKCESCVKAYEAEKISFLLDPEDNMTAYEEMGLKKSSNSYENEMKAFMSLDRVMVVDVLSEFNYMKEQFMAYMEPFVKSKKVVTEADVKRFFNEMKEKKKNDNMGGIQNFCR